jgi:hypothetical protein
MSYGAKAMTCTCQIKWIDKQGSPTPDNNPAIGRCRTVARYQMIGGRNLFFDASKWFNICAEHARQLTLPGMHIWEFEAFPMSDSELKQMHQESSDDTIFEILPLGVSETTKNTVEISVNTTIELIKYMFDHLTSGVTGFCVFVLLFVWIIARVNQ